MFPCFHHNVLYVLHNSHSFFSSFVVLMPFRHLQVFSPKILIKYILSQACSDMYHQDEKIILFYALLKANFFIVSLRQLCLQRKMLCTRRLFCDIKVLSLLSQVSTFEFFMNITHISCLWWVGESKNEKDCFFSRKSQNNNSSKKLYN